MSKDWKERLLALAAQWEGTCTIHDDCARELLEVLDGLKKEPKATPLPTPRNGDRW